MTPDELKNYVDTVLQHRDSFTFAYFILVPVISIFGAFFITYSREKGKNAATKEDVGKITTEIESSKSHFTERLELLRTDLASRAYFGKVRYEREMKVFEEIWPKLCDLRVAVLSLRPAMDRSLEPGETEESRKQQRAQKFGDSFAALQKVIEHNRPFYPPLIWKELLALLNLCWGEAVDYRIFDHRTDRDYWTKAINNAQAINEQVDKTCEAIRLRLTDFDRVQTP